MMVIYVLLTAQPHIQSFKRKKYFLNLIVTNASVSTISGTSDLIEGSGITNIMLPNGTRIHINDSLYYSKSIRNLLSFKNIRKNGYHIKTMNKGNKESLYITSIIYGKKIVAKKLPTLSFGLYHTWGHMWTYSSTMWTFSLFYGPNRCLH